MRDRQLFVTVACFTGAEMAALDRLDWTDIDFAAGRIRIPGTKNAARDRTISIRNSPPCYSMCRRHAGSARASGRG